MPGPSIRDGELLKDLKDEIGIEIRKSKCGMSADRVPLLFEIKLQLLLRTRAG